MGVNTYFQGLFKMIYYIKVRRNAVSYSYDAKWNKGMKK